ncbi:MAG: hypothetical protein ACTSRA_00465 [Promethearchaeota archaeon]
MSGKQPNNKRITDGDFFGMITRFKKNTGSIIIDLFIKAALEYYCKSCNPCKDCSYICDENPTEENIMCALSNPSVIITHLSEDTIFKYMVKKINNDRNILNIMRDRT